jgi:hypothetical protein
MPARPHSDRLTRYSETARARRYGPVKSFSRRTFIALSRFSTGSLPGCSSPRTPFGVSAESPLPENLIFPGESRDWP